MVEGLVSEYNKDGWKGNYMSDSVCVSGPMQQRTFAGYGIPEDEIYITGQPRFDLYHKEIMSKENLCEKLGLDPEKKIILYTANFTWASIPQWRVERGDEPYKNMMYDTTRVVCKYVKDHSDTQAIIKLHPQQTVAERQIYAQIINKMGVDTSQVHLRGGIGNEYQPFIYEQIYNCDTVVSFESTTILEALMCGKPTIQQLFTNTDIPDGIVAYAKSGASYGAYDTDDLYKKLTMTLENPDVSDEMKKAIDDFVYDNTYFNDGKAYERVCEVINKFLE